MRKALDHDTSSNKRHETRTSHFKKTDLGNSTDEALIGASGTSTNLRRPNMDIVNA